MNHGPFPRVGTGWLLNQAAARRGGVRGQTPYPFSMGLRRARSDKATPRMQFQTKVSLGLRRGAGRRTEGAMGWARNFLVWARMVFASRAPANKPSTLRS